eukprot:gene6260-4509_t
MSLTTYTRDEVRRHNNKKDGWCIIHNKVLNVTEFFDDHPGGRDVLLQLAGEDATEAFDGNNHSKMAHKRMEEYIIGELPESEREKVYTLEDIKDKNTRAEAWFVLHNKVYNITSFLDNHPGGRDVLIHNAGKDASKAFDDNNHSNEAKKMVRQFYVGELHPSQHQTYQTAAGSNANEGLTGSDGKALPAAFSKAGDESILGRLQEQIKLFLIIGAFILAGVLLLS